ncbi:DUF4345 family protein [Kumtagia ephedrae]|uniref:DUF4345 domain-containing protein n=1 Tax=Kumtagia ephedrae TaxID=2116701 RepID=A0A2P7S4N2_9HYPH|nr:DUF4345 family protein [Mesorhizobium ephedrae]PSJ57443.1 hypothetical protein C7I84_17510 [Mesorhizobium ephedrae]
MKTDLSFWLLLATGLSLVGVGATYWYDPEVMYRLYGADAGGSTEHHLARTAFGGLHIAIGIALLFGAGTDRLRTAGLQLQGIYLAGIIFGRLGSFLFDGRPTSPIILPEFVVEIVLFVATVGLLKRATRADPGR